MLNPKQGKPLPYTLLFHVPVLTFILLLPSQPTEEFAVKETCPPGACVSLPEHTPGVKSP
jgi:hypothetical protein